MVSLPCWKRIASLTVSQLFGLQLLRPRNSLTTHGDRFTDYLKRVMLHATPLAAPGDVAWFLASYARDAKARMEETDLPALDAIRTAMEEALSITFEGKKGSHFFLSTLVQTLFYGVFSAWVLWSKQHPPGNRKARFDWRTSAHYLARAYFAQIVL